MEDTIDKQKRTARLARTSLAALERSRGVGGKAPAGTLA